MLLIVASCCSDAFDAKAAARENLVCEAQMARAAKEYQVPLSVLYAVALTEAAHEGALQPLALNVEGAPRYPSDVRSALQIIGEAQRSGVTLIDVGCMQINLRYHRENFGSLEEMLDPRRNVNYGAGYLKRLYRQESNWTRAVARYHASPANRHAQQRYVCSVIRNMIAAGMGGWTPSSRALCR